MGVVDTARYARAYKKRANVLGMNPSTAQRRLMRNLLGSFVIGKTCHVCNAALDDTWTVEHKTSWMNKPNAAELFFDPTNISYSHSKCNRRTFTED